MLDGERNPELQLDEEVQCLFDPSSYDGSGKMNVTFAIPEATAAGLEAVEKAIGAAANCELNSSVKRKEGYPPQLPHQVDGRADPVRGRARASRPRPWRPFAACA